MIIILLFLMYCTRSEQWYFIAYIKHIFASSVLSDICLEIIDEYCHNCHYSCHISHTSCRCFQIKFLLWRKKTEWKMQGIYKTANSHANNMHEENCIFMFFERSIISQIKSAYEYEKRLNNIFSGKKIFIILKAFHYYCAAL